MSCPNEWGLKFRFGEGGPQMSSVLDLRISATEATVGLRPPIRKAVAILAETFANAGVTSEMTASQLVGAISDTSDFEFPSTELMEFDFSLATGTGKTRLSLALIEFLVATQQSQTFVVLVHREILKKRWIAEFDDALRLRLGKGRRIHVVQNAAELTSRPIDPNEILVLVQTLQALSSTEKTWADSLFSPQPLDYEIRSRGDAVVFMDESHHVVSGEFQSVWMTNVEVLEPRMLFGLTATPNSSRPVIYEYGLRDLLFEGKYSKDLEFVYESIAGSDSEVRLIALGRSIGELKRKQDALARLSESHQLRAANYRPRLLIAVSSIEEVESTAQELVREFGVEERAILRVSSRNSSEALLRTLLELDKNSDLEVVVAAYMLDEGWDVTSVSVICPLRALNSPSNARQLVGRGLRLPLGRRTGIQEIDTLTVVSLGQDSLAKVRSEVTDEFGARVKVHQPGTSSGGATDGDEKDDSDGSVECLVPFNWASTPDLLMVAPTNVSFNFEASIESVRDSQRKIAVIDASSGEVSTRADAKVQRSRFENGLLELCSMNSLNSILEISHVLSESGIAFTPEFQLEAREIQMVSDEVRRLSAFEFEVLGKTPLRVPAVFATRSKYSLSDAIEQSVGWSDTVGQWYCGFEKSISKFARFDSKPEFVAGQVLDGLESVQWWLRNDPKVFKISCPSRSYSPDFVVHTKTETLLLEVKGRHLLSAFQAEVGVRQTVDNWCALQTSHGMQQVSFRILEAEFIESDLLALF
jgi:superfamily II DNA or RNA helicase